MGVLRSGVVLVGTHASDPMYTRNLESTEPQLAQLKVHATLRGNLLITNPDYLRKTFLLSMPTTLLTWL